MKRGVIYLTLIALLLLGTLQHVHAQFNDTVDTDQFDFIVTPPNPLPQQSVTITATSYLIDLTRKDITWYVNGKVYDKGLGKTSISPTVGNSGDTTVVKATLLDQNGDTLTKSVTFTPATVDVLWQATSYTPPFYEGKALYSYKGKVTVVAVPNLYSGKTRLDPKKLVYTWNINGSPAPDASGYGKDSVQLQGGLISRPMNVTVTVATLDGSRSGVGKVTITPQDPKVVLYEESPYYGVFYNQAFNDQVKLSQDEMIIRAEPYYFDSSSLHDASLLNYEWSINGTSIPSKNDQEITLRQPGKVSGYSTIAVSVTSPTNQLQNQNQSLTITFSPLKNN